jgi:signal transduction histidine kinase
MNNEGNIVRWFGTSTDITKQIKAEENLEKKNKELTKINNDLDNFIYTASHDLKSPVSNLEGLLNLITDENEGMVTEKAKDVLPLLSQSVLRLKTVIKELAEIARIQKDTDNLRDEIVLDEIFKETRALLEIELKKYNGKVDYDFSQAPKIKFSRKNLRSILYNLLSNALKYSSPERTGEITIRTEIAGNYLMLSIKDNGLGIPENQLEKIFTMFKRYHTHVEGTGVGLYIIKRMIENAGGKIEVESEEGKGSTFKVFFKR